jgi:hypothetical protein
MQRGPSPLVLPHTPLKLVLMMPSVARLGPPTYAVSCDDMVAVRPSAMLTISLMRGSGKPFSASACTSLDGPLAVMPPNVYTIVPDGCATMTPECRADGPPDCALPGLSQLRPPGQ